MTKKKEKSIEEDKKLTNEEDLMREEEPKEGDFVRLKKKVYPKPKPIPKEEPRELPNTTRTPAPGPPGSWHG